MTSDRWPKRASLEVSLAGGPVRLCAQAKGAGMISPRFATMLCFVQTDALVDAATLDRLLRAAVERSFERVSVDGQLSTNDSRVRDRRRSVRASRSSRAATTSGHLRRALDALLRQLAVEMVADGEGAERVARLRGARRGRGGGARSRARSPTRRS